jgi:hypothetical protein
VSSGRKNSGETENRAEKRTEKTSSGKTEEKTPHFSAACEGVPFPAILVG